MKAKEALEIEWRNQCNEKDSYLIDATNIAQELRQKLSEALKKEAEIGNELRIAQDLIKKRDLTVEKAKERVKNLSSSKLMLRQQIEDTSKKYKGEIQRLNNDIERLSKQAEFGRLKITIANMHELILN